MTITMSRKAMWIIAGIVVVLLLLAVLGAVGVLGGTTESGPIEQIPIQPR